MDLAWISVGALLVAILVSCTSRINVGFLALVMAWLVGVYLGGTDGGRDPVWISRTAVFDTGGSYPAFL